VVVANKVGIESVDFRGSDNFIRRATIEGPDHVGHESCLQHPQIDCDGGPADLAGLCEASRLEQSGAATRAVPQVDYSPARSPTPHPVNQAR